MRDYAFAYHYYYSVRSPASEYSTYLMTLRTPEFVYPTSISVGRKLGKTYVEVGGQFWGSYRDYVGDYQSNLLRLTLVTDNALLGEFGVDAFYTHFQRSAYIGSYPVDTGGKDVVVDFYEEWIYGDGFGMRFTRYGEDYNLSSGFAYTSPDRVVPMFLEFKKLLGSSTVYFRQTAFWGSTLLSPKLHVGFDREFVMGRRSVYVSSFVALLLRPSDIFELHRPPAGGLTLRYTGFSASGELRVMGRGYITRDRNNEAGGEVYLAYRFARRWRPMPFVGFIFTGDDTGPYAGIGFGRLGRRFQITYYYPRRAVSFGLEVSHGVFTL